LPFTAEPITSFTQSWRVTLSRRVDTPNFSRCGSSRIIVKLRKSAVDHWAQWTSIGCVKSIHYQKRSGTVRRPYIASRSDRETLWRSVIWGTDILRRMRRRISRKKLAWRWLRCPIGSRIADSEIARRKREREFFAWINLYKFLETPKIGALIKLQIYSDTRGWLLQLFNTFATTRHICVT